MENVLCSELFREFFNNIEKTGLPIEELTEIIRDKLPPIAKVLNIGKLSCVFFTPPTPIERNGVNIDFELFVSPDGYGTEAFKYDSQTGGNGKVLFSVFPIKNYEWSESEKGEIEFLCKNIFVMLGRVRLTQILQQSLSSDVSTGLKNAMGYLSEGNRLIDEGKLHEYSAMYFNLKNFRCVNSQIGNKQGDTVINNYAAVLISKVENDEIVARLGGDNFTALIKKTNRDAFLEFLSDVPVEVVIGGSSIPFNLSSRAGVYDIQPGDSMTQVMNCISAAISTARRGTAGDVVFFSYEIMKKFSREQEITAAFANAIERREFLVYYQPKVDLSTNKMCGCEALVRWQWDGKLIYPGEFIPVFERDGNICVLDFYMLDNVCRNIKEWIEAGLEPVTVSVNFSKTHLHNPNIADDIMNIIKKYGVDSRYIEIELTEMSDFNDYNAFKSLVSKMKDNGVLTSIDDFGTGYSSLNLLTDFNFDVVKLDKSFLDNIIRSQSKTDEIVVRNIVKMIKELNMKAIAEGVETVEQARFLKEIECTMVQGYLYDKPLCVEDFVKRLEKKVYSAI